MSAPHILIVDDDTAIRKLIARLFQREGFAVCEAENGQKALDALRREANIRVILLDLQMPVMDGWTFRQVQRADPSVAHIPVVALSGAASNHFAELEVEAAFEKPVRMHVLLDTVKALAAP
jgi:CheY-like chemotaxis protein